MRTDLHTRLMASVLIPVDDGKIIYRKGPQARVSLASSLVGVGVVALVILLLKGVFPI